MMPTFLHSAHPKARKVHCCRCCGGDIPAGVEYCRETYVYDGRVYDWKVCAPCEPLNVEVWTWAGRPDEGIGVEEYVEWAREHRDDPVHGESARALLARSGECIEDPVVHPEVRA